MSIDPPSAPDPFKVPGVDPAKLAAAAGALHAVGLVFFILGFLAMLDVWAASVAVALMVGWLLMFGSLCTIASVFVGHGRHHPHKFLAIVVGLLGAVAGVLLIDDPLRTVVLLTIIVGASITAQSLMELTWAARPELAGKRTWLIFNGLAGLFLGFIIFAHWPHDSDWVLGMIFGIKMLFTGATFMSLPSAPPPATT